jgi:hypothetical protein
MVMLVIAIAFTATCPRPARGEVEAGLARAVLEDGRFSWNSQCEGSVCLHCKRGSFAERHRAVLLRSAEVARSRALEFLAVPSYERRLDVFYVDSREEMEQLVGSPVNGLADWSSCAAYLVCTPDWRSFDQHEIAHVLSVDLWGYPKKPSRWLLEGVAVYVDGWCREYSVDDVALYLARADSLPSLDQLSTGYEGLGEVRAGIAAASLVGYIRSEFGVDALRELWARGVGDVDEVLGVSGTELESEWMRHVLEHEDGGVEVDWQTIEDSGCG